MSQRSKLVDEVGERLRQVLEASPAKDLEKNVRAVLTSVFSRLDLVTREEFDVQREVLLRTRERLNELERKLAEIERRNTSS
jgi:BMFP domain-containing protein YqiC